MNFNEGSGTIASDATDNGNDGTINGDVTWSDDGAPVTSPTVPDILLDQNLFAIYSDDGDRRAEVKQTVYGGSDDTGGPFNDAVFVKYEVQNLSDSPWTDTYLSLFCDFDLGDEWTNDLVNYNHDQWTVYEMNEWNDGFENETVLGITVLGDTHDLVSVIVNPEVGGDQENYNLQQGLNQDGSPIIDPTTGEETTYMFTGSIDDSTGWLDEEPADKRVLMSVYVGDVAAQETVTFELMLFMTSNDGSIPETIDIANGRADQLVQQWSEDFGSVNLIDRPIIEAVQNHGVFGSSVLQLDIPQGTTVSETYTIRNGGSEALNLDIDTGEGTESAVLNYGDTHEISFSFEAPVLDAPKTIRVPEDHELISEALDNTTGEVGFQLTYDFNHNDPTTSSFSVNGEFYVDHAGDTILVAPGGTYFTNYEIRDRSVHIISETDDLELSSVFRDAAFLDLKGRVQYFTLTGFNIENTQSFMYINDFGENWSPTTINIHNNVFRDNSAGSGGGALDMNNVHGSIDNNLFIGNSADGAGGAIYAHEIYCDISNNVFIDNSSNWAGAMRLNDGAANVFKNTFYNNYGEYGAHSIAIRSTEHHVTSNIMWGNGGDHIGTNYDGYDVTFNLIEGGFWDGQMNIDQDPMFADPDNGDLTLSEDSPAIDSGNPSEEYNDPDGTRSDMGAFYFDQPSSSSYSLSFDGAVSYTHLTLPTNREV